MDEKIEELREYVCDKLCDYMNCSSCKLGDLTDEIIQEFNKINEFDESQSAKLLEKYSSITMCNECKWIGCEQSTKIHYCRLGAGLMVEINPQLDGCSRGVKSDECI